MARDVVFIFSVTHKHRGLLETWPNSELAQRVNFALYSASGWELHFFKEGYSAVNFVLHSLPLALGVILTRRCWL